MTLGASLRSGRLGRGHHRLPAQVEAPLRAWTAATTIAGAAALTGLIEVLLFRVGAPVLSHTPIGGTGSGLTEAVRVSGGAAAGATALLAPLAAAGLAAAAWRAHRVQAVLLAGVIGVTLAAATAPGDAVAAAGHVLGIGFVGYVVAAMVGRLPPLHVAGTALLGLAVVAGRWPLILDASPGLAAAVPVGTMAVSGTIAEAALVTAPLAFAAGVVRDGAVSRPGWRVAVGAAVVLGLAFAAAPEYLAITTMWASGVTLSLPPLAYVAAIFCLGLALSGWLGDSRTRPFVVGFGLVGVAGVMPAVVHHNITAVAGLTLLGTAMPVAARPRAVRPMGGAHG